MMLNKYVIAFVFVIFAFASFSTSVDAYNTPEVKVSVLKYDPSPAEQGRVADVWVQVNNKGTSIWEVRLQFIPSYPFSLAEGQSAEVNISAIAATEQKVVKFAVFIDPAAQNGEQNITFRYNYKSVEGWITVREPITLETKDASLVIDDYEITPSSLTPGQIASVMLKLHNAGRIGVKNVDVKLSIQNELFSTVGSVTEKRVDYISPGGTYFVNFRLASDPSTDVKIYSIPVVLDFQDERNNNYNSTSKISIMVNAEPELSVSVDSTKFARRTKPGTVSLKVVNKGVTDLKYVTLTLVESEDYKILASSNEAYIGNLDSDDFETVSFVIEPQAKELVLYVTLNFKDPYNTNFVKDYSIPLRIVTESELGNGGSGWLVWLLLLAAAGGGYYWWRKRKRKK